VVGLVEACVVRLAQSVDVGCAWVVGVRGQELVVARVGSHPISISREVILVKV